MKAEGKVLFTYIFIDADEYEEDEEEDEEEEEPDYSFDVEMKDIIDVEAEEDKPTLSFHDPETQ